MKRFLSKYGIWLLAGVAVVVVVLCIISAVASGTPFLRNAAGVIASPFRAAGSAVAGWVGGIGDHFDDVASLQQENDDLRAQVADLEQQLRQAQKAQEENQRLRRLLFIFAGGGDDDLLALCERTAHQHDDGFGIDGGLLRAPHRNAGFVLLRHRYKIRSRSGVQAGGIDDGCLLLLHGSFRLSIVKTCEYFFGVIGTARRAYTLQQLPALRRAASAQRFLHRCGCALAHG